MSGSFSDEPAHRRVTKSGLARNGRPKATRSPRFSTSAVSAAARSKPPERMKRSLKPPRSRVLNSAGTGERPSQSDQQDEGIRDLTRPWPVGPSLFLARRLPFASSLTCPCPVGPCLFLAIRLSREGSLYTSQGAPRCFTAEREAAEFVEATGRFMGKAVLPPSSSTPRLVCNNHKQLVGAKNRKLPRRKEFFNAPPHNGAGSARGSERAHAPGRR